MEETVKIFGLSSNIQILFSDPNYCRCLGSTLYYGTAAPVGITQPHRQPHFLGLSGF